MSAFSGLKETLDVTDINNGNKREVSQEAQDKFDKLMGDDRIGETKTLEQCEGEEASVDAAIENEPEANYETDDFGKFYKRNGELIPNIEYTVNGNTYCTDKYGKVVSCDSEPRYTEEGIRNLKEQKESGGPERQEDDDGGHIIARVLGGAEGSENLVPMRRTINRGDYKKMENEIARALQDGKEVSIHVDLEYRENSQRPSKIKSTYLIDGKATEIQFENDENSVKLLDILEQKIYHEDYQKLKEELQDMEADECPVSLTSVKSECDEHGNPTRVTVGILDELTGIKTYKIYESK